MRYVYFLFITGITLLFLSSKFTHSYFSDASASSVNTFTVSAALPTSTPTIITITPTVSIAPTNVLTPTPITTNHLVINEVLYDVTAAQNMSGQGGSNRGEFLEIYNPTTSPINVHNWIIEDNTDNEILSNITIPAGGYLIVTGATEAEFKAVWSVSGTTLFFQADNGTIGNGFANDGDLIRLKSNATTIVDQISWGNNPSVLNPALPDVATGHSLEREPDGIDTDTKNDFIDRATPQPGS